MSSTPSLQTRAFVVSANNDIPSPSDIQRSHMRKHYADTSFGQIHYVESGTGDPIFLLHQTPRSSDEYRDVIPLLDNNFRAIAMDTLGFGSSAVPTEPWTIELFAAGVLALANSLGIEKFHIVGHHTGGVIGMEVAASTPQAVLSLTLSGVPYVDAARRERIAPRPTIDGVPTSMDGSHFAKLWRKRAPFYPSDRTDLLDRLFVDAVKIGDRVEEGHQAVNSYIMEDRIGLVTAPTLVLCGELDEFSLPDVPKLTEHLIDSRISIIKGTGVPSVDHKPEGFAHEVREFVSSVCTRA
ncbi:alpha/beta hydrolase [Rhodococcus sp. KBS0724]|uniref:alpha/beta fold hydrolase n=1 Tax=Rhodococcus sp. KBS0724 TaxID=1179674 RepID=UPI00110DE967|nr:alpha/beta hydrolase [Rhodococcus sp. KBS0724]TSD40473.1 alpha/beta hydrolase [Rhodococcus sp. KBS0724]